MRILGIDPGMAIVGYSIVNYDGKNVVLEHSGSIQTPKGKRESARLLEIFNDMTSIAHARGVILTVLEQFNIPIYEYTPMEVKQILTGYGRADKKEVEQMVKISLGAENLPKLDDTVDSIAIAISYTRSTDAIEDLKKFEL